MLEAASPMSTTLSRDQVGTATRLTLSQYRSRVSSPTASSNCVENHPRPSKCRSKSRCCLARPRDWSASSAREMNAATG